MIGFNRWRKARTVEISTELSGHLVLWMSKEIVYIRTLGEISARALSKWNHSSTSAFKVSAPLIRLDPLDSSLDDLAHQFIVLSSEFPRLFGLIHRLIHSSMRLDGLILRDQIDRFSLEWEVDRLEVRSGRVMRHLARRCGIEYEIAQRIAEGVGSRLRIVDSPWGRGSPYGPLEHVYGSGEKDPYGPE